MYIILDDVKYLTKVYYRLNCTIRRNHLDITQALVFPRYFTLTIKDKQVLLLSLLLLLFYMCF